MHHRFVLLVALAAPVAWADEAPPPLDVFLEQRVAEELAADGTQLSRLGVSLDVELVGDKAIVSLREPASGRVVASTKLDALPVDREAAVASITQVAANLAAQVQPLPPNDSTDALRDERAERERKDELEARYKREAIHFMDIAAAGDHGPTPGVSSIPLQNDRRLDAIQFFQAVERPDLAERIRRRRSIGKGMMIAGGVILLAGSYVAYRGHDKSRDCSVFMDDFQECRSSAMHQLGLGFGGVFAGVAVGLAGVLISRASPNSEGTARELADQHNAKLRQRLQLAPYVGPSGGGVMLGGRF